MSKGALVSKFAVGPPIRRTIQKEDEEEGKVREASIKTHIQVRTIWSRKMNTDDVRKRNSTWDERKRTVDTTAWSPSQPRFTNTSDSFLKESVHRV